MARGFNGSSQYLEYAGAVVSSKPLAMSLRHVITDNTITYPALAVYHTSGNHNISLHYIGSVSTIGWRAYCEISGASYRQVGSRASTGLNIAACTWAAGTDAPALYVNGVGVSGSASIGASGSATLSRTGIASYIYGGSRQYHSGTAAEAAIWNAQLSEGELIALTNGYSPLEIRPASLVAYYPLGGHYGQYDLDRWKNRYDLTPTGSPTWADHPRVIYPGPSFAPIKAMFPGGSLLLQDDTDLLLEDGTRLLLEAALTPRVQLRHDGIGGPQYTITAKTPAATGNRRRRFLVASS